MFGKKQKRKFIAELNTAQRTDVAQLLQRLKELEQNRIGTAAVLQATIQNAAAAAGIRDLSRVAFDLDRMSFYEVPVAQQPQPQQPAIPQG